jgi:hypothetical protein
MHRQIPPIADAVLGAPVTCNDGTTTCRAYAAANHPLADLTHLGLEVLRFPNTSKLMSVLHELFVVDEAKAEDLLVAAGDVIGALQNSTITLTDTAMYDALIGIVPLIRQIFTTSNTTGKSTPLVIGYGLGYSSEDVSNLPEATAAMRPSEMKHSSFHSPFVLRFPLGATVIAAVEARVNWLQLKGSGNGAATCVNGVTIQRARVRRARRSPASSRLEYGRPAAWTTSTGPAASAHARSRVGTHGVQRKVFACHCRPTGT